MLGTNIMQLIVDKVTYLGLVLGTCGTGGCEGEPLPAVFLPFGWMRWLAVAGTHMLVRNSCLYLKRGEMQRLPAFYHHLACTHLERFRQCRDCIVAQTLPKAWAINCSRGQDFEMNSWSLSLHTHLIQVDCCPLLDCNCLSFLCFLRSFSFTAPFSFLWVVWCCKRGQ